MNKPRKVYSVVKFSREMLLTMGAIEPTPEEAAKHEAEHQEYLFTQNLRAVIREAAWAWLGGIKEPSIRAVLDLHAMVDREYGEPECAHCVEDTEMGDHAPWPCATVRAIAAVRGIEMPE